MRLPGEISPPGVGMEGAPQHANGGKRMAVIPATDLVDWQNPHSF